MKIRLLPKNPSIKEANTFTILVIFLFTIVFVGLLIDDMYRDYEKALLESYTQPKKILSKDEMLKKKHKRLKNITIKTVLVIVTLAFILFGIFFGLSRIFNVLLQRDIQTFLDFFEKAAHNDESIDVDLIFFRDFKVMVGYANEMLTTISEQKNSLKELNLGLEDRVKAKTAALQNTNENLKKEKQFSHELLVAQKEFLRHTVHETNTPLSVILTSIELYVKKHQKDKHLSKIEVAAKNIFGIYDDLSYLVKKDQIEYPKAVINLNDYLKSRVDFFEDVAKMSKVGFLYESDIQNPHIYFNETKLQRIVDNTLTNAIKYTLACEKITISLKQIGSYLEFGVRSRSKIIKDTDKVFEAYYREDSTRDGFGLGLRLVKSICDEEGVEVLVSSDDTQTLFRYRFKMMGE